MRIPERGWSRERVFEVLDAFRAGDTPCREGRTWAYVHDPGPGSEARRGHGVTPISMNLHAYALAAKGASTIFYRDERIRKYQMSACSNWTGYTVIHPTVQSTKSAGPVAAARAVLHFIGDDGYRAIARSALPPRELAPRIREAFGKLAPEDLTEEVFQNLVAMACARHRPRRRMAEIDEVLNALSVPLRERLLVESLNELFTSPEAGDAPAAG